MSTAEGQTTAAKWPTLKDAIEERWNTPPVDLTAYKQRTREEWNAQVFDVIAMLRELKDPGTTVKPYLAWAHKHKSLGKRVNSTSEDRVSKTLSVMPRLILQLLPRRGQYEAKFDELMDDIGKLSSSHIVYAYTMDEAVDHYLAQAVTGGMQNLSIRQQPPRITTMRTRYPSSQPQTTVPASTRRQVQFSVPPLTSERAASMPPLQRPRCKNSAAVCATVATHSGPTSAR